MEVRAGSNGSGGGGDMARLGASLHVCLGDREENVGVSSVGKETLRLWSLRGRGLSRSVSLSKRGSERVVLCFWCGACSAVGLGRKDSSASSKLSGKKRRFGLRGGRSLFLRMEGRLESLEL